MKKRILLTALLVVPMGIALARAQEVPRTEQVAAKDELLIPMHSGKITTGGGLEAEAYTHGEATLDTHNKQSTGYITTGTLGTQSYSK